MDDTSQPEGTPPPLPGTASPPPDTSTRLPDTSTPEANPARRARLIARLQPLVPWFSLTLGVISAVLMERRPTNGGRVAFAALAVWLLILLQRWLARVPEPNRRWLARVVYAARRSSLMATQSLLQLKLFFALPFFVKAADWTDAGHIAFMVGLFALSGAALWDPLTEHWLARRRLGALLPATASFVALTAVLPGLGLSTRMSLWIAAGVGSMGAALVSIAHAARGSRLRVLPQAALVAAVLPIALALGLSRFVPAAPLRLASIAFGNQLRDHWIVQPIRSGGAAPARLYCATAIASPLGVCDRLFHVWSKDGQLRARTELEVRGGREAGYRTASRIAIGVAEAGRFRCSVETASGQVLGSKSIALHAREHDAEPQELLE